ncbi:cell division protein ZapA [Chelatococcus reniformis]|uniref:Cell division protein ZapA n=1 Tax=Chelatococcus reniformis TaxID=1494448 RepID=A0A916XDT6_9HYPH|nr:cell division protein ZapA [Chelatococcus reniformis]GGC64386.1 cell division protein ZapA [Chelatococcus reniformis]
MAHVSVTIAGKVYRMACEDGEEKHLEGLAADFDRRIAALQESFGPIGDMRLQVMAALMALDELEEAQKRLLDVEHEMRALRQALTAGDERTDLVEAQAAETLIHVAERIERLARALNPAPSNAG